MTISFAFGMLRAAAASIQTLSHCRRLVHLASCPVRLDAAPPCRINLRLGTRSPGCLTVLPYRRWSARRSPTFAKK